MDKVKRDRSANFSPRERDILVFLVQKYNTVLENKKSDARTWKMKEAAWKSIQKEFNARSGCILRSTKTLKIKYEGLKRAVRKKSAERRSELNRTWLTGDGDGQNTAPPLDEAEKKIKAIIASSTDGLERLNDSDTLPTNQESPGIFSDTLPTNEESRANVSSKSHFNELIQAKLELVELKKRFLEAEIAEKKIAWEFERNERKKEAEFREKEREFKQKEWEFIQNERKKEAEYKEKEWKWKEEEYTLKLQNFK